MAGVPPGTVVYAIGDIHGRLDLLDALHGAILDDVRVRPAGRRIVVYLGDYVSRGIDSRGVVDRVLGWRPPGFERVTLKGNHEDLLLRFLGGDLEAGRHWFDYDGLDTLAHYGVDTPDAEVRDDAFLSELRRRFALALPPEHLDFFDNLEISFRAGDYLFVHGGVRPGVALEAQSAHDCMWIRGTFLASNVDFGATVVHGHSIVAAPDVRANRIGIDTGAYRSHVLTCLVLDGMRREFLQTCAAGAGAGLACMKSISGEPALISVN